jgi:hypothetical protein
MDCIKDEHYVEYKDCLMCMREYKATSECYVMVRKEWVKERFDEWDIEYYEDWYKDRELKDRIDKIPYSFIEGIDIPKLGYRLIDTICLKCNGIHKELIEITYFKSSDVWKSNGYIVMTHEQCKARKLSQIELDNIRRLVKLNNAVEININDIKNTVKEEIKALKLNKVGLDSISNDKYWEE